MPLSTLPSLDSNPTPWYTGIRSQVRLARVATHMSKCASMCPLYSLAAHTKIDLPLPFSLWVKQLLKRLHVDVQIHGTPAHETTLVASNHVSWLDAVVLASAGDYAFIAKNEVQDWPVIGDITRNAPVAFIDRRNRFSVYRSLPHIEDYIAAETSVIFFPEGTTTMGTDTSHFFPMIFEVAKRQGVTVQPVVVRYTDQSGRYLPEVAFVNDDSVIDTLYRMLAQHTVLAELHFLEPIASSLYDRKSLALETRKRIEHKLTALNRKIYSFVC